MNSQLSTFVCIVCMYIGFYFDWGTVQWRFAGRGLVSYHLVIIQCYGACVVLLIFAQNIFDLIVYISPAVNYKLVMKRTQVY